jgi:hypothetical protein
MTDSQRILTIEDFVEYASKRLGLNKVPEIKFATDRSWALDRRSFGQYSPNDNTLVVYINNRNMADILRTLGHELIHHKQNELGKLEDGSGKTGSDIENEANALAGVLMRDYGRINDTIYEAVIPSLKDIYEAEKSGGIQIYCDMDGVLCDFDSRFEHYYGIPPREYAKEKGQKAMEEAVNKVGPIYWSKMPWMPGGRELWSKISKYDPIILTSPGKFLYAKEGKLEWIKENLNPQPKDIIFAATGNKYEAIKDKTPQEIKRSMLIDDYWPNLAPWKQIGGIAIMHKSFDATNSILDKFRLTEIGDASVKAFPWTRKGNLKNFFARMKKNATSNYKDGAQFLYEVTSPNAVYTVAIGCYLKKRQSFVLHFGDGPAPEQKLKYEMIAYIGFNTKGSKKEKETNLNEQYGLMSSVIECLSDFVTNTDEDIFIDSINYAPKSDKGSETEYDMESKRAKLYLAFLKKNIGKLPGKWTAFSTPSSMQIRQGDWSTTGNSIVAKS